MHNMYAIAIYTWLDIDGVQKSEEKKKKTKLKCAYFKWNCRYMPAHDLYFYFYKRIEVWCESKVNLFFFLFFSFRRQEMLYA